MHVTLVVVVPARAAGLGPFQLHVQQVCPSTAQGAGSVCLVCTLNMCPILLLPPQEGWAPSSFTSSRSAPAQRKAQAVEDFLDEDELEERRKRGMTLTVR